MTDQRTSNPKESPLVRPSQKPDKEPPDKRHENEQAPDKRDVEPGSDADSNDEALGV